MSNADSLAFLSGDSAMARRMREADWAKSPLGAPAQWPQSLRSVVGVLLGSGFPMFVAWGPQLAMLYNDAYAEILGGKHPRALGNVFEEVWADIRTDIMPFVNRALGGESFYVEDLPLRMRRKGYDEDTWFTFSYSPVRDEEGNIAGFYCACAETTKAVLAQLQLRERQEWLQSLFHQAPGFAAVVRGPQHVFEMVNQAYNNLIGTRQLLGLGVAQALPEVVGQGFVELLDRVYFTGEPYVGQSVPVTVNLGPGRGTNEAFIDFMYQPLRDASGNVEGIFVQGHDVTQQHRAQQALRDADRQKDEFLATLAHELRNPLAPIRTASSLLASTSTPEDARRKAVEIIGRQVGHMSRLLDDLIDIARITQRRLVLKKESVTVASIVDAAVESTRPLAEAKGHTLSVNVQAPRAAVVADPVRLTQVVANLLNNAVKYTDPGGRIAVEAFVEADCLRIAVTDNGMGIDPRAMRRLFVMFAQHEDALERSEGGLGIGLALAKGLMELHGGSIEASSAGRGKGSRFELSLPVGEGAAEHHEDSAQRQPSPGRGARILLADDNKDAAELMAEWLGMSGYQVETAADGIEALAAARRAQPQVLVLDIGMPGLNGYEVAREVRAEPWAAGALLIAATGWGQEADRHKAIEAGFDAHLTKPFHPEALDALIAQHLANAAKRETQPS